MLVWIHNIEQDSNPEKLRINRPLYSKIKNYHGYTGKYDGNRSSESE